MRCPQCEKEDFVKNGFMKGSQRYRCKGCRCNFTQSEKRGKPPAQKILAVTLHLCGMSMNSIAEVMGVATQSVMRWVRWAAEMLAPLPTLDAKVQTLERDEMHHFLLKKLKNYGSGKCWIMTRESCLPGSLVIVISKPDKRL